MSAEFHKMPPKLQNFELAFKSNSSGAVRVCACEKLFYNPDGGWDWEEGELDRFAADPNSYGVDYSVGEVCFEGKEFANACDCWHERALQIIAFIDSHASEIAEYLTLEKNRKQDEADRSPIVS